MNHSFKIVFHKSIPYEEINDFLKGKKEHFLSPNSYKTGGWGGKAYYRRGIFGLTVDKELKYTFKRLVSNKRIFGIVPVDMLERKDGKPLDLKQCMCALHRGGQKVSLKDGFHPEDYITYYDSL